MVPLFSIRAGCAPGDTRTHREYFFSTGAEARELRIRFSYGPKVLEDEARTEALILEARARYSLPDGEGPRYERYRPLTNLITLSADDGRGFRGCAHRGNSRQAITIAQDTASCGFLPGPVAAMSWRLVLSFHSIVSERCEYSLSVEEVR